MADAVIDTLFTLFHLILTLSNHGSCELLHITAITGTPSQSSLVKGSVTAIT